MGTIRVTPRPSYYTALEVLKASRKPKAPIDMSGKLTIQIRVGGIKSPSMTSLQKQIEGVISSALGQKGRFIRAYSSYDDRGLYIWKHMTLHQNVIATKPLPIRTISILEKPLTAMREKGWYPEDIVLTYYPDGGNNRTLSNLMNILESRRSLIEQALALREPLQIIVNHGLALAISLSVFSYPAIEASAFLIAQATKMALNTGKAHMKPCDMSNPRYQMRIWLVRLGFIGEEFERPRKTLLEGLPGDTAFFSEEQKQLAIARRKAKKMNSPVSA